MTLLHFVLSCGFCFFILSLLIALGVRLFDFAEEMDSLFAKISAYLYSASITLFLVIVLLFLSCMALVAISGEHNVPDLALEFFRGLPKEQH